MAKVGQRHPVKVAVLTLLDAATGYCVLTAVDDVTSSTKSRKAAAKTGEPSASLRELYSFAEPAQLVCLVFCATFSFSVDRLTSAARDLARRNRSAP